MKIDRDLLKMDKNYSEKISQELGITKKQVSSTLELLTSGATIPFIARYRKEITGSLDEVTITSIRDRFSQLKDLDKRQQSILHSLKERGLLTDDLNNKILKAQTMTELEDIYLPYRPKRRTRATIAKEKGLEPLALLIFAQGNDDIQARAQSFINPEKGVHTVDDALSGARDIIAEWVSENQKARQQIRHLFFTQGLIRSKAAPGKDEEGAKYKDYFQWQEPVSSVPSHRILAMRRGEKERYLRLRISPEEEDALAILENLFVKEDNSASEQVKMAIKDSYKRLLSLSIETEVRLETKKLADDKAIKVFTENLRQLLLAPPLGQKNIMAIDPGFRTGCKVVILNRQGKLLYNDTIYPHSESEKDVIQAALKIGELCKIYQIEAIAIGSGTAGRETEAFIRKQELPKHIDVVMVNESGASVYSASEIAREEFPDHDVTVRGAVSIGRRLMDPLAELVKIDPKSIGVGQYQHDVDQGALRRSLDDVVISCVNAVGVDVNTASKELITYVSGLGSQLARNIVSFRNEHGPFVSRQDLKKVPKLGPKAFEQSAGFLRISEGINPLDRSAVHPESYHIVEHMAHDLHCSVADLIHDDSISEKLNLDQYVTTTVGLPTLKDIVTELAKPGRDPRKSFEVFKFQEGINEINDLKPGMKLPGIVTNITDFGAFIDIGVHHDGLVHISELANRFVKNPHEVVKVHQKVTVTVLDVDIKRKRIALSLKKAT
jgi:uncharacterized protein